MHDLPPASRSALWERLIGAIEDYISNVGQSRVTPPMDPVQIRARLAPLRFDQPLDPIEALDLAVENLWRYQTHTPHPRYFGLFNPAPATMGIAADALVAAFNPQMAAWAHSPFAAEAEAHVVRCLGARFGYEEAATDGVFCSGGAEANHTALVAALTCSFPGYAEHGARALPAQPVFYASAESHHSFLKAAGLSGIGRTALRQVPTDTSLRMRPEALKTMIQEDRRQGHAPFLVVATAGTTNAGVIDPLPELADVSDQEDLWYHVDAAWGGAVIASPTLAPLLEGIARAGSITVDAHKWFSAPMGAGIYLTREPNVLTSTFSTPTAYMPRDAKGLDIVDPHLHSMQWSRRFIGLKVFLSLLVAGWEGYAASIEQMTAAGDLLRQELSANGWEIINRTPLPVVCFASPGHDDPKPIVRHVVESGEAWISTTRIGGRAVIRACITNYRTTEADVRALVASVGKARDAVY